jgi:UDP-glucose 4-epimerase
LQKFEVFNIGTGNGTSVLEMIAMAKRVTQKDISYEVVARRSGDVAVSLANPQKANDML